MRAFLASPRRRRQAARLAFAAIAVGVAVGIGWAGLGGGSELHADPVPSGKEPLSRAGVAEDAPVEVPFTPALRASVLPVVSRFVATAVDRKGLDESWELVTPAMKDGYTRERWRDGEIPVVPYPVGRARWDVQYALRNEVALYVRLEPRAGEKVRPTTFVLVIERGGEDEPWLVSEWVPSVAVSQVAGGGGAPGGSALPATDPGGAFDQGNLSPLFLLLPLAGTAGVILLVGGFFALRGWRRNRRAAAASGGPRELPPLPSRYTSAS